MAQVPKEIVVCGEGSVGKDSNESNASTKVSVSFPSTEEQHHQLVCMKGHAGNCTDLDDNIHSTIVTTVCTESSSDSMRLDSDAVDDYKTQRSPADKSQGDNSRPSTGQPTREEIRRKLREREKRLSDRLKTSSSGSMLLMLSEATYTLKQRLVDKTNELGKLQVRQTTLEAALETARNTEEGHGQATG